MKQIVIDNLDFIYLFYGAAFFFLGTSCLVLNFRERVRKTLPWLYLSLFAFIHGFNEWLDMLVISFLKPEFLEGWRTFILAASLGGSFAKRLSILSGIKTFQSLIIS